MNQNTRKTLLAFISGGLCISGGVSLYIGLQDATIWRIIAGMFFIIASIYGYIEASKIEL